MSYFTDDKAMDRIQILYFIKSMGTELTKVQIASAFDSCRLCGYLETTLMLDEMESGGLLAAVPCEFGQVYVLTPEGKATLDATEGQLPKSVKNACDTYIREYGESLLRMEQFYARILPGSSGGVDVVLRAVDHNRVLLSMVMNLPDMETAKAVCENWERRAESAYAALMNAIL